MKDIVDAVVGHGTAVVGHAAPFAALAEAVVEMTGNGFQVFRLGADLRLVPVQNPDNAAQWMIRATVPLMKLSEEPIGEEEPGEGVSDNN